MFLLQEMLNHQLPKESSYYGYRKALTKLDIPFKVVTLHNDKILFLDNDNLIADVNHESVLKSILSKPFVPLGSVAFNQLLINEPKNLFNNNLKPASKIAGIVPKELFVNQALACDYLKNLTVDMPHIFLRPLEDNKVLTGGAYTKSEFMQIKKQASKLSDTALINSVKFTVSPVQYINDESRIFVVDREIVASSRYAIHGKYNTNDMVSKATEEFANAVISKYPEVGQHYVLDIATLADGTLKIMEYNALQASGTYKANPEKIVKSLLHAHLGVTNV